MFKNISIQKPWGIAMSLALALSLSSCIKDKSQDVSYAYSDILLADEPLGNSYSLRLNEILTLQAPAVKQTNATKPLSYLWEVDGKVVSTEPTLTYQGRSVGVLAARLTIRNEDVSYYHTFRVEVKDAYLTGYYILADSLGKPLISYIPDDEQHPFERDILWINNQEAIQQGVTFTGEALALAYASNSSREEQFLFSTKTSASTSILYRLNAKTLTYMERMEHPKLITWLHNPATNGGGRLRFIEADGKPAEVQALWTPPLLPRNDELRELTGTLANKILDWRDAQSGGYRNHQGTIYYDNQAGKVHFFNQYQTLLSASKNPNYTLLELNQATQGLKLVDMTMVRRDTELELILRDEATGKFYLVEAEPRNYTSSRNATTSRPVTFIGKQEIPASAGFTPETLITATITQPSPLLYYSSGRGIYAYNIESGRGSGQMGNFPTQPEFEVDDNETIVGLGFTQDDRKLYVATNSNASTAGNVGNIYTFDRVNRTRLDKKAGITGKIKALTYRSKPYSTVY